MRDDSVQKGGKTLLEQFGALPDGRPVTAYTLVAQGSPRLRVLDLGAAVQSLRMAGEPGGGRGGDASIVLGHAGVEGYAAEPTAFHGAVVGRYANRIAGARLVIDGTHHRLDANEGDTCLHGGADGFHRRLWSLVAVDESSLTLRLVSPDGDQGFPGELTAEATYAVAPGRVTVELTATTTAPTVVSLASHAYFNLAGEGTGSVDGHLLTVAADTYLPLDAASLPVGGPCDVRGTPFDLTTPGELGARVRDAHPQVGLAAGFDHAFVLRGRGMRLAARLEEPRSGRWLEVHTDQPTLQVYTGNSLSGREIGESGRRYRQGDGIALEAQRHPDAPNQHWMPSPVLRPGETYRSCTEWHLGAR